MTHDQTNLKLDESLESRESGTETARLQYEDIEEDRTPQLKRVHKG